jgi:hypothetical protein
MYGSDVCGIANFVSKRIIYLTMWISFCYYLAVGGLRTVDFGLLFAYTVLNNHLCMNAVWTLICVIPAKAFLVYKSTSAGRK